MMYYHIKNTAVAIHGEQTNWNERPNLTCAFDFLYQSVGDRQKSITLSNY